MSNRRPLHEHELHLLVLRPGDCLPAPPCPGAGRAERLARPGGAMGKTLVVRVHPRGERRRDFRSRYRLRGMDELRRQQVGGPAVEAKPRRLDVLL